MLSWHAFFLLVEGGWFGEGTHHTTHRTGELSLGAAQEVAVNARSASTSCLSRVEARAHSHKRSEERSARREEGVGLERVPPRWAHL